MRGPLTSVAGLRTLLDDPAVRVADTRWYLGEPDRGRATFGDGHVPGAVYVDLEHHLSAPAGPGRHPLPDPFDFTLAFCEMPPVNEKQIREAPEGSTQTIRAPVKVKLVVPAQLIPALAAALQENMRLYQESYSNVRWNPPDQVH